MATNPSFLDILKDPGILERRFKIEQMRYNASIISATLNLLLASLREAPDLESALVDAIAAIGRTAQEDIAALEAIDNPPKDAAP